MCYIFYMSCYWFARLTNKQALSSLKALASSIYILKKRWRYVVVCNENETTFFVNMGRNTQIVFSETISKPLVLLRFPITDLRRLCRYYDLRFTKFLISFTHTTVSTPTNKGMTWCVCLNGERNHIRSLQSREVPAVACTRYQILGSNFPPRPSNIEHKNIKSKPSITSGSVNLN